MHINVNLDVFTLQKCLRYIHALFIWCLWPNTSIAGTARQFASKPAVREITMS